MEELIIQPKAAKMKEGDSDTHDFHVPGTRELAQRCVDEASRGLRRNQGHIIQSRIELLKAHAAANPRIQDRALETINHLKSGKGVA